MRAAVVTESGVRVQEVPEPAPKPNEVLVRVHAAGLNRADLGVAAGQAHGRMGGPGTILGLEFAGAVVAVGAEVPAEIRPGMRVMASGSGSYAEYAVADWGRVSPVPDANMGREQAATLPVALQTMHDAVVTNGGLRRGESILIQGHPLRRRANGAADRQADGQAPGWCSAVPPARSAARALRSSAATSPWTPAFRTGRTGSWRRRAGAAWR